MRLTGLYFSLATLLVACGGGNEKKRVDTPPARQVQVPAFNADSAYVFVSQQVKQGPRIPGTPAHDMTGDLLAAQLRRYGANVRNQSFSAVTFDGKTIRLRNIMGSFNPQKQKRILLAAHWDTRPFADKDADKKDARIDGANDGASGVAVLLEIARQLSLKPTDAGIDIMFFDGEDWGEKHGDAAKGQADGAGSWWCLGSQHWVNNKMPGNYSAYYGILLDMVGAKGARFYREGYSMKYAPKIVEKVWSAAEHSGHASAFIKQDAGGILDDHVFVNEAAGIPMVDIIEYYPDKESFGDYHHTRKDNMDVISKEMLGVTGSVVMQVIYNEE